MILKLKSFFQKPHPFIFNQSSLLIPFVITFLVVLIFRPFEFSDRAFPEIIPWALAFGLIASACVWGVVMLLQRFSGDTLLEDHWTVGKEILLILSVLLCIMLVIFSILLTLNPEADRWQLLVFVLLRTFLISIFPVLVLVLYEQYHYQKLKRQEAQQLNLALQHASYSQFEEHLIQPAEKNTAEKISLMAENQKIALRLEPAKLLFVRSEGNYVEVFYLRNQEVHKELIRAKLSAIEEQLPEKTFFRCHKSFLVNLQHIVKVEGNARNLELVLEHCDQKIPVSRSKSKDLPDMLQG
jgi:DNA-binding LytR/AlgR family response regulator